MVYGSTSFVPLLKGREQQDAVTGLERDLDRAHLLAHVLRHALDGAAPRSESSCEPASSVIVILLPMPAPILAAISFTALSSSDPGTGIPSLPFVS